VIGESDEGRRKESVAPIRNSAPFGISIKLSVTLAHQPKRVVIEAKPDMEPMFLDAIGWTSSRRALTSKQPAQLINSNLVFAVVLQTA